MKQQKETSNIKISNNDTGATLVEYLLLISLIAMAALPATISMGMSTGSSVWVSNCAMADSHFVRTRASHPALGSKKAVCEHYKPRCYPNAQSPYCSHLSGGSY